MRTHYPLSWSLGAFIVLSSTACGGSSATDPDSSIPKLAGGYTLVTANDSTLPALVVELSGDQIGDSGMAKIYMDIGLIDINNNGTCFSMVQRTWATIDDDVIDTSEDSDTCTWTQAGSTITFTHSDGVFWRADGSSDTATLGKDSILDIYNRLTMTFPHWHGAGTVTLVFER